MTFPVIPYENNFFHNVALLIESNALGVVHNCQHLPISTESTNLGGGGRGEGVRGLAYYFFKC